MNDIDKKAGKYANDDERISEENSSEARFEDEAKDFLKQLDLETNPAPPQDFGSMSKTLRTGNAFDPTLQKPMRNIKFNQTFEQGRNGSIGI